MPINKLEPPPTATPITEQAAHPAWQYWFDRLRQKVNQATGTTGGGTVEGIANYVLSGLLGEVPTSGLTITSPAGVVYVNGTRIEVAEETYTYPPNSYIQDEIDPDGLWIHTAYDSYALVPAEPPSGGVYVQQVSTSGTAVTGIFDRRTLEPMFQELQEFGFYWPKLIQDLTITDSEGEGGCYPVGTVSKKYTGAIRYGANNGVLWYFSNLGVYHLIGHLDQTAVLNYLNCYILNLDEDYIAFDVYANTDATLQVDTATGNATPRRPPDSHDSYAATFLMCAVKYVRTFNDWGWLATVNTRFGETNHQTLLNIMVKNLTTQVKTAQWCIDNGIAPYEASGATLLTSTFQNGMRKEDGLLYKISFVADNCEVYHGLKLFGDLLNDYGDTTNGATTLQFATNIGTAVHGLFDVTLRRFVPNDSMISWQPDNTYLADGSSMGTAWYPDLFCQIFTEMYQVPSGGGDAFDGQKFNDAWEFLMGNAPLWWKRAEYDSFPDLFFAYMATAFRKRPEFGEASLAKFFKYMLTLSPTGPTTGLGSGVQQSGNTAGFAILSEVGFAVAIQDIIVDRLGTNLQAQYPFSELQIQTVKASKRALMPAKTQSISAFYEIQPLASLLPIDANAPVLCQATPTIAAAPHDGFEMVVFNSGESELEFQDESSLPGSTLRLGGANHRLAQWDAMKLIYLSAAGGWVLVTPLTTTTIFDLLRTNKLWVNQIGDDPFDSDFKANGNSFLNGTTTINGELFLIPALPISQGGTGQTNAEGARATLNAATRNHTHGVNVTGSGSGFAPEGGGLVVIT